MYIRNTHAKNRDFKIQHTHAHTHFLCARKVSSNLPKMGFCMGDMITIEDMDYIFFLYIVHSIIKRIPGATWSKRCRLKLIFVTKHKVSYCLTL